MSAKLSVDKVLTDAARIAEVWEANPEFQLGNVTLADYQSARSALQALDNSIESRRVELTGLIDQRDDKTRYMNDLNTRALSGFRGFYGPDAPQYGQAGGTRRSERKTPTRKAKGSE
jgi:hypothetical protein